MIENTRSEINALANDLHENAVNKGWWQSEVEFPVIIALCHSELSEALEEHRDGKDGYYLTKEGKPAGKYVEFADCIIRILDYCAYKGVDIDHIIRQKHEYNQARPWRHGGKMC